MTRILLLLVFISFQLQAQQILPEKQRAEVVDQILKDRFNNLLPKLMDDTGFDMWILISREYNEDPV
ncbi:MAG: Xaa-Pro aminopeptidase, partial [Winogradskyella sp.]